MKIIQHPAGFLRVEFSRNDKGESDRLHVWGAPGYEDGDIHQHSYDFMSEVLTGVMAEHLYSYREDENGEYERWKITCGADDEGNYHVDQEGEKIRVIPVLLETILHVPGDTYVRPAADFHLVQILEAPLVTRSRTSAVDDPWHYFLRKREGGS